MEVRWDSRLWRMWEWRWKGSMWWGEGREGKEGREGEERRRKGGEERRFSRPFAERGRASGEAPRKGRKTDRLDPLCLAFKPQPLKPRGSKVMAEKRPASRLRPLGDLAVFRSGGGVGCTARAEVGTFLERFCSGIGGASGDGGKAQSSPKIIKWGGREGKFC